MTAAQRSALASLVAADRIHALLSIPKSAFAAVPDDLADLEAKIAYLTSVFVATPDDFEHEHPSDPVTYAEAINSPHLIYMVEPSHTTFSLSPFH